MNMPSQVSAIRERGTSVLGIKIKGSLVEQSSKVVIIKTDSSILEIPQEFVLSTNILSKDPKETLELTLDKKAKIVQKLKSYKTRKELGLEPNYSAVQCQCSWC